VTDDRARYAEQSAAPDPGKGIDWYDGLPDDPGSRTAVVPNLVVHQDRVS
jgi:hypothetical protein